jgi:exodeoxyribonuclease V beta subunit
MEVERVLLSISEPDNPGLLKAALAMDMMGARGEELLSVETDAARWETLLIRMRECLNLWQRSGFMPMFRTLLSRDSVRQRLLSFADGERRLTNVLHLAEILHRESVNQNLGVRGTLKWLAEQRDPRAPRLEEHQLRLESDAQAIQIVTIHKSKGLEYPVVFCPYGWEGSIIKNADIVFHQPETTESSPCLTMDLGSESYDENRVYAQNELLAENIRLLYVAVTRAKSKCYLAWGRINTAESSALAYLLHADSADHNTVDHVSDLKRQVNVKLDTERLNDLLDLAKRSSGCIEVTPLPESTDRRFSGHPDIAERMSCRIFSGTIDAVWKVSSYSALTARKIDDVDLPDRDALDQITRHLDHLAEDRTDPDKSERSDSIFSFPRGSRAGNFFHDIFEHLDYTADSGEASAEIIRRSLQNYGFKNAWQPVVSRTVDDVLRVPLTPQKAEFTLSAIALKDRVNEMEFYFPLHEIKPSTLQAVFKRHGSIQGSKGFTNQMGKLTFSPVKGFMKGYIDLVFHFQDRFYLLDWKSNYLGHTPDNYQRHALEKVMHDHFYVLQYHLYVLALCQHLRLRNPGFRYEIDFGGAFYVFLRGVDQRRDPNFGIFHDRPHLALINSLGQLLIPEFKEFV